MAFAFEEVARAGYFTYGNRAMAGLGLRSG